MALSNGGSVSLKQGDNYRKVPYFEAHITVTYKTTGDDHLFKKRCDAREGWTFSHISGDIILGPGVKMYGTKHYDLP